MLVARIERRTNSANNIKENLHWLFHLMTNMTTLYYAIGGRLGCMCFRYHFFCLPTNLTARSSPILCWQCQLSIVCIIGTFLSMGFRLCCLCARPQHWYRFSLSCHLFCVCHPLSRSMKKRKTTAILIFCWTSLWHQSSQDRPVS